MNHFFVVGAGLLGGAVGFAACAIIAIWLAKANGVSAMEGAHGYLGMVAGIGGAPDRNNFVHYPRLALARFFRTV